MKNYIQKGEILNLTAPYAVSSGDGLLVTAIFGVAVEDAAISEAVEAAVTGVYDLTKAGVAIAIGEKMYWDNTNKVVTNVSTSNTLIGVAVAAALIGDATARVRLNGSF